MGLLDRFTRTGNSLTVLDLSTPGDEKRALTTTSTALVPVSQGGTPATRSVGVQGRTRRADVDVRGLINWQRRNEIVYSCIEKIADAAMDPMFVVEALNTKGDYEAYPGHPLQRLLSRPNPLMDEVDFRRAWVTSEHVAGVFYAEIVRNGIGLPVALYPLNPAKVSPVVTNQNVLVGYQFVDLNVRAFFRPEDILVRRAFDITNPYGGLSPLAVALNSVDADAAQTDFIRSFFNGGGQPSGVLTVADGKILSDDDINMIQQQWMMKYGRKAGTSGAPAVLENGATYAKIGSGIDEIESGELRAQHEARICGVFGVPPVLVGAYAGIVHQNNRAGAKAAQEDFWINKMSPLFRRWRSFINTCLLPEWEGDDAVISGKVRAVWDMSQVLAMQEDVKQRQELAATALKAGGITLNEYRKRIGEEPDANGAVYMLPSNVTVVPAADIGQARTGTQPTTQDPKPA